MINMLSPKTVVKLLSYWPPYLMAGVKIDYVQDDFKKIVVKMKQRFWNTNYVGSHFGGSLYSMTDPFYMFMLLENLKQEHIVWDQSAEIEFLKPAKGVVTAVFEINDVVLSEIKSQALEEFSFSRSFDVEILDESKTLVAKVKKGLYIRRKDAKKRFSKK